MYNTKTNRQIAQEIDHINKQYAKHQKALAGQGYTGSGLQGAGFLDDFWTGFQIPFKTLAPLAPLLLAAGKPKRGRKSMEGSGFLDEAISTFKPWAPIFKTALGYGKGQQHYNKGSGNLQNLFSLPKNGYIVGQDPRSRSPVKLLDGRGKKKGAHCPQCQGSGWLEDSMKELLTPKNILKGALDLSSTLSTGEIPKEYTKKKMLQSAIDAGNVLAKNYIKSGGRRGNPNINNRALAVKKIMKEQGLSMIEASKYVKNNGIAY